MKIQKNIAAYFIIWLIALGTTSSIGYFTISRGSQNQFIQSLANWDGAHYLEIAKNGYTQNFQYAFFPFFPITVRLLSQITQNFLFSALLISFTCSFLAVNIFYKLVRLEFSKEIAEKGVIYLLIFPTSFYLLTAYSEGLFMLLVISSFYFFKKEKILLSVIFASLASATRLPGLAVSLALLIEVLSKRSLHGRNWLILFAPMGFLSYCLYLFLKTGNPTYFLNAELYWLRSLAVPGLNIWETVRALSFPGLLSKYPNLAVDLIFTIFGIGMVLRSFRFLPTLYSVYGLISLLLPLTTPTLMSMPRFVLPIFPIFILMALIKNKNLIFFYQLMSILLLSALALLFINSYWVS